MRDLQSLLDDLAAGRDVAGASVAVGHAGRTWTATTGVLSRDTGFPVHPDRVFQIGSVTKLITAALVMTLVDDGAVDLDAPVRRYLPTFDLVDREAAETVTVRHLLAHTGGFLGDLFTDTGRGDDALARYVARLRTDATQLYPPGELMSYCNAGYCVLGALAVAVQGADTYEALVRERLLAPLGMTRTAFFADEALVLGAAVGHLRQEGALVVAPRWQLPRSNAPAGATLCATPSELITLGRWFLAADNRVSAAMRGPAVTVPGVPRHGLHAWGLGPELYDWNGTPAYGHDGGTLGQETMLRIVPGHDLVVAICTNGNGWGLMQKLLPAIVADRTGATVPPSPTPPADPPVVDVTPFVGRYAYPLAAYEVHADDGGLRVRTEPRGFAAENGAEPVSRRYVPLSADTFVAVEGWDGEHATVTFPDGGRFLHAGRAAPRR